MRWLSLVSFKTKSPVPATGGFSLIELMISITIMVIVISIVSTSQGAFNAAVLLRGQAYEAALTIREVQLNAVSAVGDAGVFRAVYGVHFNADSASNGQYAIFKDANSNGFYEASEAFGQQSFLDNRFEIRAIRPIGDTMQSSGGLSIVFVRPNFDARFFDTAGEVNASGVEIDIARRGSTGSDPGAVRTVEVTATGQISVKDIP